MTEPTSPTVLLVGASRGIGLAMATEFIERGWHVIATVRGSTPTELGELATRAGDRLTVERVDMTNEEQVDALHDRLSARTLDLLFVSAAMTNGDDPIGEVPEQTFVQVMVTNAYAPMRFVERFLDLVASKGTIVAMSSRQGSISMNTRGGYEVYRASKSALNQLMRSFAARHQDDARTLLLMNPGHVQTELGGPGASVTPEQSATGVVDTITAHAGDGGLQFLDYQNNVVAW